MTSIKLRAVHQFSKITAIATASALLLALSAPAISGEQTVAAKLFAAYEYIETISCQIRKTTDGSGSSVTMLSRVFYKKPDHIHVENVSPSKRRIIADGKKLFYHEETVARGFSKPISELEPQWLAHLRNIPGTPMEHLRKLIDIQENELPATPEFPVRKSYQAPKVFVVLSCDTNGCPVQFEFFKAPDMKEKTAQVNYSSFTKVSDSCWIPCLHKTIIFVAGGDKVTETRRIDNLEVNKPIADNMFSADLFFQDIEFVADFKDTYSK